MFKDVLSLCLVAFPIFCSGLFKGLPILSVKTSLGVPILCLKASCKIKKHDIGIPTGACNRNILFYPFREGNRAYFLIGERTTMFVLLQTPTRSS